MHIHNFAKKIIKFYAVWTVGFIGTSLIIHIWSDIYKWNFLLSLCMAYIFNITIIFRMQKYFTFEDKSRKYVRRQFVKFSILIALLMVVFYYTIPLLATFTWSYLISNLIISLCITIINFIIQNYLIFARHSET